jgi:4-hydroxy-tetrahydrodipicolinate synthase
MSNIARSDLPVNGVFCASLTPLNADLSPDLQLLGEHCSWLLESGCDGIALLGTTGEANSFSISERIGMLESVVRHGIPAGQIVPGTGVPSIEESVELTKHALSLGVNTVLVLPPYYYKNVSDEGLLNFYSQLIDRVDNPALRVLLYHIPPMSQVPISFSLITRLLERYPEVVVGVKDSGGDLNHMAELIRRFPGFSVFAGSDHLLGPALREGGAGCITATANIISSKLAFIAGRYHDDEWNDSVAATETNVAAIRSLFEQFPMIAALKATMASRTEQPGWNRLRPPLVSLSDEQAANLMEMYGQLVGGS